MLFLSIWISAWDMHSSESCVYTFLLTSMRASGNRHTHPWRGLYPRCHGMPSPSTGAHWSSEQDTNAVCSATLTEHRSHRDPLREVETDFQWKHHRFGPWGSRDVSAQCVHREIHSQLRVWPHTSIVHWFNRGFSAFLRNAVGCRYSWMQT